jgi:DNA polymerase IV
LDPNTTPSSVTSNDTSNGLGSITKPLELRRNATVPTTSSSSIVIESQFQNIPKNVHNTNAPTPLDEEVSFVNETPVAQGRSQRPDQRRAFSDPVPLKSTKMTRLVEPPILGKRKRGRTPFKLKHEDQQIFKGLTFFYIPNDDVALVRRTRIVRAQEHGATWTTQWDSDITHVVVDETLSYNDVLSFLNIPAIPPKIIMVADGYPIDCIQFRALLDPLQKQYKVLGLGKSSGNLVVRNEPLQGSDGYPPLKHNQVKPNRWDYIPPPETPERSQRSPARILPVLGESIRPADDTQPSTSLALLSDCSQSIVDSSQLSEDKNGSDNTKGNELDIAIRDAQQVKHLPLDEDDYRPSSRDSKASDESDTDSTTPALSSQGSFSELKDVYNQENFSCMNGGTGQDTLTNPNAATIAILEEMADHYTKMKDTWRSIAYRKVITTLRKQPNKITAAKEAEKLPSIGKRLALKIEEIVNTSRLRRLESAKAEPADHILECFLKIYGVGLSQASKWIAQGHKTLEDLQAHVQLTENQQIGIDHYDDLLTRIPRDEVTALGEFVKKVGAEIDPRVEFIIGGSYRRGSNSSGDIDFIVTRPETTSSNEILGFLHTLVTRLTTAGFLVAALVHPSSESGTKWHGCCVLPGQEKAIWRRIDFLVVPETELGAALIYFTGNDIFNRSIRLLASRKGMRLNQRGLYKNVMRGPARVKVTGGELVEGADEKKIFEALGVPWRPPEERIC